MRSLLLGAAIAFFPLVAPAASTEPVRIVPATAEKPAEPAQGIADDSVSFAQVAALEGAAGALGSGMRVGIMAAFEEANRQGGVHGRKLKLDSFDDGYEPERSAELVESVIDNDAHIGLIGPVGTPTAAVTQPLAKQAEFPYIGPFTGAGFLRDPSNDHVLNVRATYGAETEAWIAYLVDQLGLERIALLYQDDGFGRVGLDGVTAALEKRGLELAAAESYTRNTTAVKMPLLALRDADPDAIVMVGAYQPIAEFIVTARQLDFDKPFVNISFVGSSALADALGTAGEGVIISQVVPFPWDDSLPIVAEYHAALEALDPDEEPGFVSLEGYLVGRVAIAALEAAGRELSRETYLAQLSRLGELDLGGMTLSYGEGDNQGSDRVFLSRITADGSFEDMGI